MSNLSSGVNRNEYLIFFDEWLKYQFNSSLDIMHNVLILGEVYKIVDSEEEALYWGSRDNWTMYYLISDNMKARAIEGIPA